MQCSILVAQWINKKSLKVLVSNQVTDTLSMSDTHQSSRLPLLLPAHLFELALSSSTNLKPVSFQEYKYFKNTKHQSIFRTSPLIINWGSEYRPIDYTRHQWLLRVPALKLYKTSIKISLIGKRWHCGGSKRRSWRLSFKDFCFKSRSFFETDISHLPRAREHTFRGQLSQC